MATAEARPRARGATVGPARGAGGHRRREPCAQVDPVALATVVQTADLAAAALPEPLEHEVVRTVPVSIRDRPNPQAEEVGQLEQGCVVRGFPGKGWLQLCGGGAPPLEPRFEGCWVFIGNRLEARCMRVTCRQSFMEAVSVVWEGLPTQRTGYSIEWEVVAGVEGSAGGVSGTSASSSASRGGHTVTREPEALLGGLPSGATVRVRAAARVFAPSGGDVRVLGPWCDVRTSPSLLEGGALGLESHRDPFGNQRGGCEASRCSAFVWTREADSMAPSPSFDPQQVCCLRCGHAYDKHHLAHAHRTAAERPGVAAAAPRLSDSARERVAPAPLVGDKGAAKSGAAATGAVGGRAESPGRSTRAEAPGHPAPSALVAPGGEEARGEALASQTEGGRAEPDQPSRQVTPQPETCFFHFEDLDELEGAGMATTPEAAPRRKEVGADRTELTVPGRHERAGGAAVCAGPRGAGGSAGAAEAAAVPDAAVCAGPHSACGSDGAAEAAVVPEAPVCGSPCHAPDSDGAAEAATVPEETGTALPADSAHDHREDPPDPNSQGLYELLAAAADEISEVPAAAHDTVEAGETANSADAKLQWCVVSAPVCAACPAPADDTDTGDADDSPNPPEPSAAAAEDPESEQTAYSSTLTLSAPGAQWTSTTFFDFEEIASFMCGHDADQEAAEHTSEVSTPPVAVCDNGRVNPPSLEAVESKINLGRPEAKSDVGMLDSRQGALPTKRCEDGAAVVAAVSDGEATASRSARVDARLDAAARKILIEAGSSAEAKIASILEGTLDILRSPSKPAAAVDVLATVAAQLTEALAYSQERSPVGGVEGPEVEAVQAAAEAVVEAAAPALAAAAAVEAAAVTGAVREEQPHDEDSAHLEAAGAGSAAAEAAAEASASAGQAGAGVEAAAAGEGAQEETGELAAAAGLFEEAAAENAAAAAAVREADAAAAADAPSAAKAALDRAGPAEAGELTAEAGFFERAAAEKAAAVVREADAAAAADAPSAAEAAPDHAGPAEETGKLTAAAGFFKKAAAANAAAVVKEADATAAADDPGAKMALDHAGPAEAAACVSGTGAPQPASVEEAVSMAIRNSGLAEQTFTQPLEYEVVRKEPVSVRKQPHAQAEELGQLAPRARVLGFSGKGWLRLVAGAPGSPLPKHFKGRWVFIGCRLQATCMRTFVRKKFSEALQLAWQGVPSKQAVYSVEWRPARLLEGVSGLGGQDAEARGADAKPSGGHVITTEPTALLCGILAGATIQARVAARVMGPEGHGQDLRVLGPWTELETGPPVPEELELISANHEDPYTNQRGECLESGCFRFVWKTGQSYAIDKVICLRCGQHFGKHKKILLGEEPAADSTSTYVVKSLPLVVRAWPHLRSQALGTLEPGVVVQGVPYGGWLSLDSASIPQLLSQWEGAATASSAWVLLDGSCVGLGQLLERREGKPAPIVALELKSAATQPAEEKPAPRGEARVVEATGLSEEVHAVPTPAVSAARTGIAAAAKDHPAQPREEDFFDPFADPALSVAPTAVRGGLEPLPGRSQLLCVPLGVGCAVPRTELDNRDLQGMVDKSAEWIRMRTGVCSRRVLEDLEATRGGLSYLAGTAAQEALQNACCDAKDVDLLVLATSSADDLFGGATSVAARIGASNAVAFDLTAACSGFLFALVTAAQFLHTGMYRRALVVGADVMSRWVDWSDRNTAILFGDGAGAMVLGAVEGGPGNSGVLGYAMHSDGGGHKDLQLPFESSAQKLETQGKAVTLQRGGYGRITMNGGEVYSFAVQRVPEVIQEALTNAGMSIAQVDWLLLHQANIRIIEEVARKLWIPPSKVIVNLDKYGNTSAGSIPLALAEAVQARRVKPGDVIVCAGFGAGLSWGAAVLRWGGPQVAAVAAPMAQSMAPPPREVPGMGRVGFHPQDVSERRSRGPLRGPARGTSAPPPRGAGDAAR